MVAFKKLKLRNYVDSRTSLRKRAVSWASRVTLAAAVTVTAIATFTLVVENNDVNATIEGWDTVVKTGAASTASLRATLDQSGTRDALNDAFFDSDDWTRFTTIVAVADAREIQSMKNQIALESQSLIWPQQRSRLLTWSDTITLSLDSSTRVKLYAARAYTVVCEGGDRSTIAPMFELGGDQLALQVIKTVSSHCAEGQ